jgi:hypothetical protein
MISRFLKRRIVSENVELLVMQAIVLASAVLIVGYAFIKMAMLHLTEAQWLFGLAIVIALVLQCMILAALIDLKRKGVEQSRCTEPGDDVAVPRRTSPAPGR